MLIRGVGHMSLPIHRRAVHEIGLTLAQLDARGTTVTRGVTSIASDRADDAERARPTAPGMNRVAHRR
jgi:hypothetical protein